MKGVSNNFFGASCSYNTLGDLYTYNFCGINFKQNLIPSKGTSNSKNNFGDTFFSNTFNGVSNSDFTSLVPPNSTHLNCLHYINGITFNNSAALNISNSKTVINDTGLTNLFYSYTDLNGLPWLKDVTTGVIKPYSPILPLTTGDPLNVDYLQYADSVTGDIKKVSITGLSAAQSDVEIPIPTDNTKFLNPLRAFQGFIYWLKNSTLAELTTTSKTIVGAINELRNKLYSSWDKISFNINFSGTTSIGDLFYDKVEK